MSWGALGRPLASMVMRRTPFNAAVASRGMAYWNKDWKPGPFPKTPEERAAAAKKYGLRPEDYEPYPDDGMGYGDYPMLPRISAESRSAYDDWDIPEFKRNYGEPLHVDADILTEEKWNPTTRQQFSYPKMMLWLGIVWGGMLLVTVLVDPYPHFSPAMPKQYAADGKTHYTFEPAE